MLCGVGYEWVKINKTESISQLYNAVSVPKHKNKQYNQYIGRNETDKTLNIIIVASDKLTILDNNKTRSIQGGDEFLQATNVSSRRFIYLLFLFFF